MKWFSQVLVVIYGLSGLYFIYMAIMGSFVYFANKSMGHDESFLEPGRNWVFGLLLAGFAWVGWKVMQNPESYKWGIWIVYLPFTAIFLFFLWFLTIHVSTGGRWN
jgi:hypothetical protein